MDDFKHAKIARWRHCNADSLKTLKANYMLIRLLCVYKMIKYVGKILLLNSKQLLRKLQKILGVTFFAAPCTCKNYQVERVYNSDTAYITELKQVCSNERVNKYTSNTLLP